METYNNNFLSPEITTSDFCFTKAAEKIYNRMVDEGREFLWTDRETKINIFDTSIVDHIYDTMYGYVYETDECLHEREVKGFAIYKNCLFICLDVHSVYYPENVLKETFEENDGCWYCIYNNENKELCYQDDMNTPLTMLSIMDCVYQYFD